MESSCTFVLTRKTFFQNMTLGCLLETFKLEVTSRVEQRGKRTQSVELMAPTTGKRCLELAIPLLKQSKETGLQSFTDIWV